VPPQLAEGHNLLPVMHMLREVCYHLEKLGEWKQLAFTIVELPKFHLLQRQWVDRMNLLRIWHLLDEKLSACEVRLVVLVTSCGGASRVLRCYRHCSNCLLAHSELLRLANSPPSPPIIIFIIAIVAAVVVVVMVCTLPPPRSAVLTGWGGSGSVAVLPAGRAHRG
jgi:hypothetical protein